MASINRYPRQPANIPSVFTSRRRWIELETGKLFIGNPRRPPAESPDSNAAVFGSGLPSHLGAKMKVLGALVAMAPFASSLVPFGQPAAHQLSVGADRKGAPIVPKSSGLRQPRKASRDKKPLARLASALLPSLFEGGDEAEELPDEPEPSEAMRRSNSRDELMHRICD